jgi:glutaredoxin
LLNSKGVQYKEIDVTSTAGAKDEMEKRTNGRRTVPQVRYHSPEPRTRQGERAWLT